MVRTPTAGTPRRSPPTSWRLATAALPLAVLLLAPVSEAWAQRRASGGYARPSVSARTPSFGGGGGFRTPSVSSGGYGRPGGDRRPSVAPGFGAGSASDRAYSRERSGDALRRMRERQTAQPGPSYAPAPAPGGFRGPAGGGGGFGIPGGFGGGFGGGGAYGRAGNASRGDWPGNGGGGWFRDRGWSLPGSVLGGQRSFGIWNAAMLWFLLDSLNRPGHADFFRNNRDDPGTREWRAEAERLARNDADLRRKLDDLDRQVAAGGDAAPDPGYLPPDVPPEVALAPDKVRTPTAAPAGGEEDGGGFGTLGGVVLVGGGALAFLAWRRARAARGATTSGSGGAMGTGGVIGSASAMLRNKLDGAEYTPSRFRVGMSATVDPTPFLLLAGAGNVPQPRAAEAVPVAEVGRIGPTGTGGIIRLYLPEGRDMFQVHLGADGGPAECRYFGLLDEIAPADEAEWGVWLDPAQGMIGWPEFQTKDGRVYARAWAPGAGRVPPRELVERVEGTEGTREVRSQAMLYSAPTGVAAPAPQTEYVLVAAVEDEGRAWVEVRAGLDVSPASLALA